MTAVAIAQKPLVTEAQDLFIEYCSPAELLPTEEYNEGRASALVKKILSDGIWSLPIMVEVDHMVVMDGHHRLQAAQFLGLQKIPAVMLRYGDQRLSVTSWIDSAPFDTASIISAGRNRNLLPYKSTRHILSTPIPTCAVPLADLR